MQHLWSPTIGVTIQPQVGLRAELSMSIQIQVGILQFVFPLCSRTKGKAFYVQIYDKYPNSYLTWLCCPPFFPRFLLQYSPELYVWIPAEFPQLGASKQVLQMLTYSGTGCCQVNVAGCIATLFRRFFVRESSSSTCSTSEILPTTSWNVNIK